MSRQMSERENEAIWGALEMYVIYLEAQLKQANRMRWSEEKRRWHEAELRATLRALSKIKDRIPPTVVNSLV